MGLPPLWLRAWPLIIIISSSGGLTVYFGILSLFASGNVLVYVCYHVEIANGYAFQDFIGPENVHHYAKCILTYVSSVYIQKLSVLIIIVECCGWNFAFPFFLFYIVRMDEHLTAPAELSSIKYKSMKDKLKWQKKEENWEIKCVFSAERCRISIKISFQHQRRRLRWRQKKNEIQKKKGWETIAFSECVFILFLILYFVVVAYFRHSSQYTLRYSCTVEQLLSNWIYIDAEIV